MKTIGLIGGMSWESTAEYYRIINEEMNRRLGGSHSASILLYSFDFQKIEELQDEGEWEKMEKLLIKRARILEKAGADLLIICANTIHKLAPGIKAAVGIPLIDSIDATGREIVKKNIQNVGLLGTRYTMEEDFYRERLEKKFDLGVIVPMPEERKMIHHVIYHELVTGKLWRASRNKIIEVIGSLEKRGAEGIILGCTELPLLISQEHSPIPLFDTTTIHALAAVDAALAK